MKQVFSILIIYSKRRIWHYTLVGFWNISTDEKCFLRGGRNGVVTIKSFLDVT